MGWTEERVTLLRNLWADGLSAAQIAKQLGNATRNAVIGKIHRLGLSGRATPSRPAKRASAPRAPRNRAVAISAPRMRLPPSMPVAAIPHLEPMRLENGAVADVLALRDSMCKFPIGDPSDPSFAFCARKACSGPYCADHARLAYQPSQPRRRRDSLPPLRLTAPPASLAR